MKIHSCMKKKVACITDDASIGEAARIMVDRHVGLLPIVNPLGKYLGIVDLKDFMALELPDFINLIDDVDFVHDFGAVESTRPGMASLARGVVTLMRHVEAVEENCGLLRAFTLMMQNNLSDLPVVNDSGHLVGIVSRVDIGTKLLSNWPLEGKK